MQHGLDSLSDRVDTWVERSSRIPYLGILIRAGLKGSNDLSKDMSASIAYFTFLSLFPMVLGLFAIGGYFLESEDAQAQIIQFLSQVLPQSLDFVTRNIETLIRLRGAVGIASALVLMWSASKMVAALSRGINNALAFERPYASYLSLLRNFGLTLTVAIFVFATIAIAPLVEVIDQLRIEFIGGRWNSAFKVISSHAAGLAVSGILLSAIYRRVPYHRVDWKSLFPGIVVAALAIEAGKDLFALYVGNLSRFDAVYGSVSSMIVLLIWLYFSARVVIYGAEVISVYRESRPSPQHHRNVGGREE